MRNELKQKITQAIKPNSPVFENIEACEKIARDYAIQILDQACQYKTSDGNAMYINLSKLKMAVKNGEI